MFDKKILVKSILYRTLASIFIAGASFVITEKIEISILMGICDFIGKLIIYYIYEIVYLKLKKHIRWL